MFEHVINALVHGSGYERIATPGCSDRTIRRRLAQWAGWGLAGELHAAALRAYDQLIGLELGDVAVDGCATKAPCGGERAGPSPVDRRKGGLKRSLATEGYGVPLGIASAGANRHNSPLLAPTLNAAISQLGGTVPEERSCHLDAGYDGQPARQILDELGFASQIARKGVPAPIQAGTRWVVERTHAWMNGYGKLRRCTERTSIAGRSKPPRVRRCRAVASRRGRHGQPNAPGASPGRRRPGGEPSLLPLPPIPAAGWPVRPDVGVYLSADMSLPTSSRARVRGPLMWGILPSPLAIGPPRSPRIPGPARELAPITPAQASQRTTCVLICGRFG